MTIILGTYHVSVEQVPVYCQQAFQLGVSHFDTAQLYKNEKAVVDACQPYHTITTKIFDNVNTTQQLRRRIKQSQRHFTGRPADKNVILLHNPMPNEFWKELVQSHQYFGRVGISNYDLNALKNLLHYCDQEQLEYPQVHQMEIHPFVNCQPIIDLCQKHGITVQGHSCLVQGKCFNYQPLLQLAAKYNTSSAGVLLQWALSKKVDVCVTAKKEEHLKELVTVASTPLQLSCADLEAMNEWCHTLPIKLYTRGSLVPRSLTPLHDPQDYINQCVQQLREDEAKERPSILCEQLPSYCNMPTAKLLAQALFPDKSEAQHPVLYRAYLKKLRSRRLQSNLTDKLSKKGMCCLPRRRLAGEYDEHILEPRPMPVAVTPPVEFDPFFHFLKTSNEPPADDAIFVKGAMFPDGRMDLCKQVVGPTSIKALCATVLQSSIVKHFLLGNNVAFQENGEDGAEAMAEVMRSDRPIETWYLAGNCIGAQEIKPMAEALQHNTVCKALWLKRNPIKAEGCVSLNQMLRLNQTLVLLDLHNCGLGNEGAKNLFQQPHQIQTLKHLYLDANAIEAEGLKYLTEWCAVSSPVTLFLSINRLGDSAIKALCQALHDKPNLKRLCLASTHLGNEGLQAVVTMAKTCPKLVCLNLGCYKSTADLGENPGNLFDDSSASVLTDLLLNCGQLQYLSVSGCKMSKSALMSLPRPATVSMDLGQGPWHHVHSKDRLRLVKQPKRVVHIDSIYRNKM